MHFYAFIQFLFAWPRFASAYEDFQTIADAFCTSYKMKENKNSPNVCLHVDLELDGPHKKYLSPCCGVNIDMMTERSHGKLQALYVC